MFSFVASRIRWPLLLLALTTSFFWQRKEDADPQGLNMMGGGFMGGMKGGGFGGGGKDFKAPKSSPW